MTPETRLKRNPNPSQTQSNRSRAFSIALMSAGVLFLAGMLALIWNPGGSKTKDLRIGSSLADFSLASLDGGRVSLSDYAGRPVLINAWATWCPPCKAEMPDLEKFYQAHKSDGFVVLAIDDGDPLASVRSFITEAQVTFPVLLDPNGDLLYQMGIQDFPTSIFVDRKGVVRLIHVGLFTPQAMERELAPLLKGE